MHPLCTSPDDLTQKIIWQAVYWFLGLAFGFCFLGATCGWSTDSPILNLETEIAELELEIKKAELQKEFARLSK